MNPGGEKLFLFSFWGAQLFLRFITFLFITTQGNKASRNSHGKYNIMPSL